MVYVHNEVNVQKFVLFTTERSNVAKISTFVTLIAHLINNVTKLPRCIPKVTVQ